MWAQEELGPAGKHVAKEALCSATYWVLDSLPAALVAIQCLQNVLLFLCVYPIVA